MLWHFTKSIALAGLLAWGVQHLSGSDVLAIGAAVLLMMLRIANLVPFATVALPVMLGALVVTQSVIGIAPMRQALSLVQAQIQTMGVALAAETGGR